jgi:YbbR domain-containing protein
MVTGNSAVLSQIQAVLTVPLDVSDETANLVRQVNVVVPAGVSIVGETKTVSCKVTVEPVLALAVPDVALEVRGAESRWKVSLGTASVSVLVSGTDSAIKALQASQIKPYIDVSQPALADGTYEVFVDGLPQGVVSASVTPQSVAADIQKGQ